MNFEGRSHRSRLVKSRRIPPFSDPNSLLAEQGIPPTPAGKQQRWNSELYLLDQGRGCSPLFLVIKLGEKQGERVAIGLTQHLFGHQQDPLRFPLSQPFIGLDLFCV